MDWKPKSEPLPDEMKRSGETFLVGHENEPHWFAFVSPADDGDLLMVDKDGHDTSLFADYSNEMDRGDMGWTHWARIAGPAGDDGEYVDYDGSEGF